MRVSRLLVWAVALTETVLGAGLVLLGLGILAGVAGPWDVNGVALEGIGGRSFAAALVALGAAGPAAGSGLMRGKRWAPILAVVAWPVGATFVLGVDRLTPGPRLPLLEFLLHWAVLPSAVVGATLLVAHVVRNRAQHRPA